MTILMALLALFNGLLVITGRIINARLGGYVTPAGASFWNHLVGSLLLSTFLPFIHFKLNMYEGVPLYLYLGGIIGAAYVAVNNLVLPRLGATNTTVLVIAGQIIIGIVIDLSRGKVSDYPAAIIGTLLIVTGFYIGNSGRKERIEEAG